MADRYVWVGELSFYNIGEKEDQLFGSKRRAIAWVEKQVPDVKWRDPDPEVPNHFVGETDRDECDNEVLCFVTRRQVR